MENKSSREQNNVEVVPVRGSLRYSITTSSPQVMAGSDFSIFVIIQNPFDIPITIYQVQTHIPVELVDVNGIRLIRAEHEKEFQSNSFIRNIYESIKFRFETNHNRSGIAIAVGTDFDPSSTEREFVKVSQSVEQMGEGSSVIGVQFAFPENPTSEELDKIFRRLSDYRKGLIPVELQPGDSIVRQFVLRTQSWLFFTPLNHKFQIQVNYSSDGIDHTDTITYEQSIRATIGAMTIGAVIGAAMGTLLKNLTNTSSDQGTPLLRVMAASVLASIAVVIAFARKSTAQSIVSVEDFWGGALIGFTTGFFGFEQFFGLFTQTPKP